MSFSSLRRTFATRRLENLRLRPARNYVRQRFSQLGLEALEVRALMAIDSGAAVYSPLDVDQDGFIAPNDALLIINELNRPQAAAAAAAAVPAAASLPETMTPLLDVDGDGVVAASDAQMVFNALDSEAVTTLIRIRLEVTDLDGNPITHVATGESFLLKGYVLDQRPEGNEGVFAAFADVTWASALASATGAINHGAYTTGTAGTASPGLLDEIGGVSGQIAPLGPTEQLLFSVNFTAGPTAGNLQFAANPADLVSPTNPTHNSLLSNDPAHTIGGVPTSLIDYGSVSVAIQTSDPVTVSIAPPAADIIEGNTGTTPAEFVVTLSAPSTHEITVNYTTQDGTATSPGDYATNSGTVTFAPGETQKVITVNVVADRVKEEDSKTFSLKLSNPGADPNWSLTQDTATATIADDEPEISIEDPEDVSEGTDPSSVIFVVTLSHPSDQTITVDYTTVPGTAQDGTDFTAKSGTLTFLPGDTSQSITVSVLVDTVDEPIEQFSVKLSNPVNAAGITRDTGTVKIIDDDAPPSLIINPVAVTESANGDKDLTFTVSLSKSSEQQLTFNYTTVDGTATSPLDFTATSGVLVFESGQRDKTVTVKVHADALVEGTETLKLRVTSVTDLQIATAEGIGTINDEDVPVLSVNNPTITEGTGSTSTLTFTVHLQPPSLGTVSVDYTIAGVTAALGSDFQAAANNPLTGTLTFAPNEFDKTVSVTIVGDGFYENNETLTLTLSNPVNASLSTEAAVGTGTITDDDLKPKVTIGTPTAISEGNSGTKKLLFPVTLDSLSGLPITVHYSTADGTAPGKIAVKGLDYTGVTDDTVTIAPGQQSTNIEIDILSDTNFEPTENFTVTISNPTNADIPEAGPATAVGTILDDDVIMSIANPAAIVEGTSTDTTTDDKVLEFEVTLSTDESDEPISVHYSTSPVTASAGSDFTAIADGVLTFAPGEKTKKIQVTIKGDALNEPTETFKLTLSNPSGATLDVEHLEATGTITDNDDQPSVKIGPPVATTTEGNTGTKQMSFPVTLSAPSGQDVIVHYSTANRPAGNNSAVAGSDYTQVTEGTLTITAGNTTGNILIDILGDTTAELSESFDVNLLSTTEHASLGTPITATGTILDDDALISITGPTTSVTEGAGAKLEFVVTLLHASSETITVNYSAGGGTASSGNDYTATSGTLQFAPNETTKTISIPITDDSLDEADETFNVTLSNSTGGSIDPEHTTATGTIVDNDPTPTVKIDTPDPLVEGNTGTKTLVFPVKLSAASGQTVVVHYKTTDGTAHATTDFNGVTDNTLTFAPGDTQKNIVITVLGDTTIETTEQFTVTLTSSDHADLGTPIVATGTITDDDNLLSVATPDAITEGTGETKTLTFVVTLAQQSTETVTVDYVAGGGTATSGADYTPASGTLIFEPGQKTKTVVVTVTGDALNESTETLNLTLSNPTNAGLDDAHKSAIGTINDDDSLPKVSIGTPSKITEGNGTKTLNFPVTLSAPSGQAVTISYSTTAGTATAGSDFTGVTDNTITIPAGQTSINIPITILGDTQVELDESFTVTISNPQNAALDTTTTATGTIADDDAVLTISDASVVEGKNGLVQMVFTVSLSSPQSVDVTVRVNSHDGTALADDDYRLTRNVLVTIPAGQTSATVSIDVGGDSFQEADERFTVELSNPTNAVLGAKTIGTGTIINDDQKGLISGFAYVDTNNNGTKDPGEKPLAGVMIRLVRQDTIGVPVDFTTLTAADGSYSFGGLDPGIYRVTETQPAGLADGKDVTFDGHINTTGDSLSMTTLGETWANNNFGERGVEAPVISKRNFFANNKTTIPSTPPSFAVSAATATINIANAAAATASGTGTPGVHVALVANDGLNTSIGYTTTVGADGKWSITGIDVSKLKDGTINYQLAASDNYGNTALINRTATKAAVAITSATEQINTTNVTNVSVSGTVQPGATVKVVASDNASTPHTVTATATVAANGTWTITGFDLSSLNDGPIQFVATATDASNNSVTAIRKVSKGTQ